MRVLWVTASVILVDQVTKFLVYLNMYRNQSIDILGDWLKLTFTENPGMAFGINFGPKGMVTSLAVVATILIVVYMWKVRSGYWPYLMSLALILGGALGNIIDRIFYGIIFGYGSLFSGKVVDFIHVDLWRGTLQDLIPFLGGGDVYFALFPIWNVADMAIVAGVVGILLFQQQFHERNLLLERERLETTEARDSVTPSAVTGGNGQSSGAPVADPYGTGGSPAN